MSIENYVKKAIIGAAIVGASLIAGCGKGGSSSNPIPPVPVNYRLEAITKRMSQNTIAFTSEKIEDYTPLHSESRVLCDVVNFYGAQPYADKFAEILSQGTTIGVGAVDKNTWLQLLNDWNDNSQTNNELDNTIVGGYGVVFDKINYQVGFHIHTALGNEGFNRVQLTQTDFDNMLNEVIFPILNRTYELNESTLGTENYNSTTGEQVVQSTFDI